MQNQSITPYNQNALNSYQNYAPAQAAAGPSASAVNIQIYNPTANTPQGFYQNTPCGQYPYNYNNNFAQAPQPQAANNAIPQAQANALPQAQAPQNPMPEPSNYNEVQSPNVNQTFNVANSADGVAGQAKKQDAQETSKVKKEIPKTELTDEYIKTLEGHLNSDDKLIRLAGAKELLERFKEDNSRREDVALTALLNKVLQDPAETVKFMGLATLDAGYASGNEETYKILNNITLSDSCYGEDAKLASKILARLESEQAANEANLPDKKKASGLAQNDVQEGLKPQPIAMQHSENIQGTEQINPAQTVPAQPISMTDPTDKNQKQMIPKMENNGKIA